MGHFNLISKYLVIPSIINQHVKLFQDVASSSFIILDVVLVIKLITFES